ncbi:MAG: adenylyltransferase/cytidyltransferase family protein [Candidatus ainarchaeum sp.]|nr:adenylyltransferase/cytidyltransferase family protein [Candidatus ainarchaeum sp.]
MVRKIGFIGRFQPTHIGHIKTIKYLLKKCDELFIVIPSFRSFTIENPLSGNESKKILIMSLKDSNIDLKKIHINLVRQPKYNKLPKLKYTYNKIRDFAGEELVIFTANKNVYSKLIENNIRVKLFKRIISSKGKISATKIRELISKNENIDCFLTISVIKYLEDGRIYNRIKNLYNKKN